MWRRRVTVDRLVKAVEVGDISIDQLAMVFNRFQPTSVKPPTIGQFHPVKGW
jgi:hypothetical protein